MTDQVTNKTDLEEKPLVTFALIAYNQENFVGEAITAAFSQTYSPLEIILSDDCSSDGTFKIMQQAVSEYEGPHKIIINRNQKNLNIGDHVNAVGRLASGKLIVLAAGDDVSLPNRTAQLVDRWLTYGKSSAVLCSDFEAIDLTSKPIKLKGEAVFRGMYRIQNMAQGDIRVLGATTAITKDIFNTFPPLAPSVQHEDRVLPFRAMLLGGGVILVDEKLVQYRVQGGISRNQVKSARDFLFNYTPNILTRTLPDALQRLADLEKVSPYNAKLRKECLATIAYHRACIDLAKAQALSLEFMLMSWLLKGARPRPLIKYYLKIRFFWIFNLFFLVK